MKISRAMNEEARPYKSSECWPLPPLNSNLWKS